MSSIHATGVQTHRWQLVYEGFEPGSEALREALCTLGNGYFAARGAACELSADEIHYPGTYLAGGYNRLDTEVAGRIITNEDLVNFPNWLLLSFRIEDEGWFRIQPSNLLNYRQVLDMRAGTLERHMTVRDQQGRETRVYCQRLVHMRDPHLAAIRYQITPLNWSGNITIRACLDGSVINAGVARYGDLNSRHLEVLEQGELGSGGEEGIYLRVRTNQSRLEMAQTARTRLYLDNEPVTVAQPGHFTDAGLVGQDLQCTVEQQRTLSAEKIVTVYTSRDRAISEPLNDARESLAIQGRYEILLKSHAQTWDHIWRQWDIELNEGADSEQQALRLHIFHLLQSVSQNSIDLDVGVTARGLHGEAYRGHVFWDELFIFPCYNFRSPEITRSLLMYRYRRLDAARHYAEANGFRGAMFPWQSGSNGREETQELHLNPRSGHWGLDISRYQRHVNIAIAYNLVRYYTATADHEFMVMHGAEMLLEITRFWASATTFNMDTGRYEIHGVMGPDEYHEKYPDSEMPGLKNNAYTNIMVVWLMEHALSLLEHMESSQQEILKEKLGLNDAELQRWADITRKMTVPFLPNGLIAQFEGYENLLEFDWEGYRERYGNIERLDRILKAEGDSPDRYKLSKQADVLMLFYLMPPRDLRRLVEQLGYKLGDDVTEGHVAYYRERTSHGSTLSKVVHAAVVDRFDRDFAWELFCGVLRSDVDDVQGGTTPEGIHLGAMAGSVDIALRQYAGINMSEAMIGFNPRLPAAVQSMKLRIRHRHQWFNLEIDHQHFHLTLEGSEPTRVKVLGQVEEIQPNSTREFRLLNH